MAAPPPPTDAHATTVDGDLRYRIDPLTGDVTYIAATRQGRPNLPSTGCPFCPGGIEAPDDYDVFSFPNRWPPIPGGRSEVVLYSPIHDATFWSLGIDGARKVIDLWADRSTALGARDDVRYVLVFENRGAEVGATIAHPHGQIYGYDVVPPLPRAELEWGDPDAAFGSRATGDHDERLVSAQGGWRAWVPWAATWPYELLIAPLAPVPDLPSLDDAGRDDLAAVLVDVLARVDRVFDEPMPYMLWIHQRPFDGLDWPGARVHLHVAPFHRSGGTPRYVAAAEQGGRVFYNPVDPELAAQQLRARVRRRQHAVTTIGAGDPHDDGDPRDGPLIEAFAPGRVNLIGEHTDYTGGLAVPMAIHLGTTVRGHRSSAAVVTLSSDDRPHPAEVPIDIADPATVVPAWARYVAGVVHDLRPTRGFRGTVSTTLPIGSGLSSSAALELAVALALGHEGTARELAELGQRAEQLASGVPCGLMDQLASAEGRDGHALLMDFTSGSVVPVAMPDDLAVVVVHSGQERSLAGSAYADRRASCETAASLVGPLRDADLAAVATIADPLTRARARHVVSENERVRRFVAALRDGDRAAAGRLMIDSHRSLRDDFAVSTDALDSLVDRLVATPGVHGARLTGAGFGGCVVALTEPAALDEGWTVRPCHGAALVRT